ncbi:hypothetical protein [Rahnella sikkimica]|uniref:Aldo/keto reductase n=1 Tax=Rahnella sikkimica TaxID=1805933 RepID=A0A2L1UY29_9GAMM|nr:hypothetical protein [Rahnella sikkimica]AVF37801.1 hypothetical protein BV494_23195 [Rahnella sikkimica]
MKYRQLGRSGLTVSAPGMDKVTYIEDNLKSIDLILSPQDLSEMEATLSGIHIQGGRLDDALLSLSE